MIDAQGDMFKGSGLCTLDGLHKQLQPRGVTRLWLKSQLRAGNIPHVDVGRAVLFDVDAVWQRICELARERATATDTLQATGSVTWLPADSTSTEG